MVRSGRPSWLDSLPDTVPRLRGVLFIRVSNRYVSACSRSRSATRIRTTPTRFGTTRAGALRVTASPTTHAGHRRNRPCRGSSTPSPRAPWCACNGRSRSTTWPRCPRTPTSLCSISIAPATHAWPATEGGSARVFRSAIYQAKSWDRARYVVAKVDHLGDKPNPRFVVTTLDDVPAHLAYERAYCGTRRGPRRPSGMPLGKYDALERGPVSAPAPS